MRAWRRRGQSGAAPKRFWWCGRGRTARRPGHESGALGDVGEGVLRRYRAAGLLLSTLGASLRASRPAAARAPGQRGVRNVRAEAEGAQQLQLGRRHGVRRRTACDEPVDADRVEDRRLVDVFREGQLHEDAVDLGVGVEVGDDL